MVKAGHGGHENETTELPPCILKGSDKVEEWLDEHEDERVLPESTTGSTEAHRAVQDHKTKELSIILSEKAHLVNAKDENGWTPLHEAARTGSVDAFQILIEKGADVNAKTEYGESPLYLAQKEHGEEHPLVDLLIEMGALFSGPEL